MTATSRRSRNYKEKNSMFAFGHFALPIAALVAVGLLFVGIKLFFLTPPNGGAVPAIPVAGVPDLESTASGGEFTEESLYAAANDTPGDTASDIPSALSVGPISDSREKPEKSEPAIISTQQKTPVKQAATAVKKTPAALKKTENMPAPSPAGSAWAVQVGAFSKAEGANVVLGEMKKLGYSASISKSDASGSTFHRVRVAAGNSRADAQRLASALEKRGYPVLVVPSR
ncbi:MAG: SPOR domain-containing protein [Synergistaceae bacterium]|jgi:cell division septation protein DedD|nr:SPOR domain-containing protein [Synergistaceae bacterium]